LDPSESQCYLVVVKGQKDGQCQVSVIIDLGTAITLNYIIYLNYLQIICMLCQREDLAGCFPNLSHISSVIH
jgi:hypothetical protein